MAQLSKPPISIKAYRHLAGMVVLLTAALAIFVDGENRQAVADEIEARERRTALQRRSAEITGPPQLVRRDPAPTGSWDRDVEGSTYGSPSDDTGGVVTRLGGGGDDGDISVPGFSQAYLESLSEEELQRLLAALEASGRTSGSADRERDLRQLERLSAARSGRATPSID